MADSLPPGKDVRDEHLKIFKTSRQLLSLAEMALLCIIPSGRDHSLSQSCISSSFRLVGNSPSGKQVSDGQSVIFKHSREHILLLMEGREFRSSQLQIFKSLMTLVLGNH